MFITKKHLSRRTFLRGALGTAVALPMLDAMVPALRGQSGGGAASPLRFAAIYMPNGVYPQLWHPETTGSDFEFNRIMKPLEPFRDHLVTISGMKAPWISVHLGASAGFLNGTGPAGEMGNFRTIESRKTIDQHIADKIAGDTPLRSIELGTEDMGTAGGACDGFPCVFFNTLSWRDDTSPLPISINPRVTFERMFGETGTAEQRFARLQQKQSMLDSVAEQTARLQRELGEADNAILDEYLTNVRQVELQLSRMEARADNIVDAPDAPMGIPSDFDAHLTLTYELMRLAYQGDISRVSTFMLGHEASSRSYSHIGVGELHHNVSHHGDKPEGIDQYAKLTTYQMMKFAEFLGKMKSTPDGDGTLLDHSLIYWGSGMSNGNKHDRFSPPAVLLGGANGRLKGNRHIAVEEEPTSNLLLGLADVAGAEVMEMGPSTGRISL